MAGLPEPKPHFVLVPLFAQGHMIPMADLACLLAERGAQVSLITTAVNAARFQPTAERMRRSGLPFQFIELPFPCAEAGLPDGCENADLVRDNDLFIPFFRALELLREPLLVFLLAQHPRPSCIIADWCCPWAADVARDARVPRLVFHGPSCFYSLCDHTITEHRVYERVADPFEPFLVPDVPVRVEMVMATGPGFLKLPGWEKFRDEAAEARRTADGALFDTFDDLERPFIECYEKALGVKVWTLGPFCLYYKDADNKAVRGNKAAADHRHQVIAWLDSMAPKSVVYVSFGSMAFSSPKQLFEIGGGLDASNRPFLWVIKEAELVPEVERWLEEEFQERTRGRGLIIKGWAPQLAILSHPAVGGFVTHCGWNSMLESMSMGVPMATWPIMFDQFVNEKLAVEVLGVGVPVGVKAPAFMAGGDGVTVRREDVEKAVSAVMDGGKEGDERRERVREIGEKARRAMEEGGSSEVNLTMLVQSFAPNGNGEINTDEH